MRRVDFRSERMAALFRAGSTLSEIGVEYGITRERVRQLLKRDFGITRKDGGGRLKAEKNRSLKAAKRDADCISRRGCTWDQYVELRRMRKPLAAFLRQKGNAGWRGIEWNLTLWQWWTIWQESGHWNERGRGQGYVMCRVGDAGPYAVGNVFIAPARENTSKQPRKTSGLPMGVLKNKSGYAARRCIDGKSRYLGSYPSPEMAHAAYLAGQRLTDGAA